MKMLNRKVRLVIAVSLPLLLGACATTGLVGPSQMKYAEMSNDERMSAKAEVDELAIGFNQYWKDIGKTLYNAHQPVRMGTDDTGYTIQWMSLPGDYDAVNFYPGHNPKGMSGNNSEGMYTAVADKHGNILYWTGKGGVISPNKLLANVTTSEDVGRLVVKGLFQMGTGAMNGIGAAIVNKKMDCDGCSTNGPAVINQVMSSSAAIAESAAKGTASSNVGAIPMD